MSNKFDFPSRPYPKQIWPEQRVQGLPQYIWSDKDKAWFKYKIEQYRIVPEFLGSVNEGKTIRFLIQANGVEDGTLIAWEIENITTNSEDFDTSLTGFVRITNNESTLDIPIKSDNNEEEFETFRVKLNTSEGIEVAKSQTITIRNITEEDNRVYSVLPSSEYLLEGDTISFYIFTQNVVVSNSNEKTLDWQILGLDTNEIIPNQTSGTLNLDSAGNGSIGFKIANNILSSGDALKTFTFNLIDQGVKVSEVRVEVNSLEVDNPPVISSLTISPSSIFSGGSADVIWAGANLSNNDEIRMYSASDTLFQNALQSKKALGSDTQGAVGFSNITTTPSVVFAYYALIGDPVVEKLLEVTSPLTITQVAAPPPSTSPSPVVSPLVWSINNTASSGSVFYINGLGYTGGWQWTYSLNYVSGNRDEVLSVSTTSTFSNDVSFTASPSSFSFGSSNSRSFTVTASVLNSPLEDKTYPVSFSLSSQTQTWTIYIKFKI